VKHEKDEPPVTLTPEQHKLYHDKMADVPEEAVKAALRDYPRSMFSHLTPDDMLGYATIGGMEGVATFDPEKGAPLRTWVFYSALHKLLENVRADTKRYAKVIAMLRAKHILHLQHTGGSLIEMGVDGTDEINAKLHGVSDGFYARTALEMAAAEPPHDANPEEVVGVREAAAWAGNVTRKVVSSLEPEEASMLDEHFAKEKKPLTQIAAEMGLPRSKYRTFVRDFDLLLAKVGKRLRANGMKGLPVWIPAISGSALSPEE
jgi:hypothetical protein